MKFNRSFKYLQVVAAISLMMVQTGPAMGEDAKAPTAKSETAVKSDKEAKPEAAPKAASEKSAQESPGAPVAMVNGAVITRGEVDRAMRVLGTQSQMGGHGAAMKADESAVIDQLISAELLYQAGEKLGTADVDKQVAEKVAQGKAKFPNDEAYEKALKSAGLDPKSLEELLRKDVVINNLVTKEIVPKAEVSDEEAKKFYEENKEKLFKKPEQVRASHILCGVDPKASKEDKEKAKEKAEKLLKEIKEGKDFAELAKQNSSCPSSAKGGDLGFFGKGQMVPSFESAAFALKPGQVSDVVETQFGYHIIKVTEKKDSGEAGFDEVKERIQQYLKNTKIQKGVLDYVAQLRSKAKIETMAK